MPGMTGVELGERLEVLYPELPVLLMSGYSDSQIAGPRDGARRRPLIEKPFTSAALLIAIERAVEGAAVRSVDRTGALP
jgi:FixJ family two-component response regulator